MLAFKFYHVVVDGVSLSQTIMDCLNGKKAEPQYEYMYESSMGINDDSWEDWEEWMGWEGAGIRDYSSHINHSIP